MSAMLLFENDKNGARPTQSSGEVILVLCKRFLTFVGINFLAAGNMTKNAFLEYYFLLLTKIMYSFFFF